MHGHPLPLPLLERRTVPLARPFGGDLDSFGVPWPGLAWKMTPGSPPLTIVAMHSGSTST